MGIGIITVPHFVEHLVERRYTSLVRKVEDERFLNGGLPHAVEDLATPTRTGFGLRPSHEFSRTDEAL